MEASRSEEPREAVEELQGARLGHMPRVAWKSPGSWCSASDPWEEVPGLLALGNCSLSLPSREPSRSCCWRWGEGGGERGHRKRKT